MPRITRAALRSQVMLEEAELAAATPLPLTPVTRVPLGEITGNKEGTAIIPVTIQDLLEGENKPKEKRKRGKVSKKAKKPENRRIKSDVVEVLEDDNQSVTSSAVDEACHELMQDSSGEIHQVVVHDERPRTPPSLAVNAIMTTSNSTSQTPKFDPEIHKSEKDATPAADGNKEDSFVETIDSHTPAKMIKSESAGGGSLSKEHAGDISKEKADLFLEQIMRRSPVRKFRRIEDSVEALDAFEEAIEMVDALIPAIPDEPRHSSKVKRQRAANTPRATKKNVGMSTNARKQTLAAASATSSVSKGKPRTSLASRKIVSSSPSSAVFKPALEDVLESGPGNILKPSTAFSATATIKSRATTKRVSSIHKAPFQTVKSTKPPTRPNFELPGDAVARKLKEQREERLKRGEEEPLKKAVFKGCPVRLSQAPVVKPTATSKARISLAKADPGNTNKGNDRTIRIKPVASAGSILSVDANKRLSSLSVAKRSPRISTNTSARLVREPSSLNNKVAPPRHSSVSAISATPIRVPLLAPDLAQQKLRGKEVFNRNRVEQDERDRIKKEKEEAARKARAEAAERGRLASREWAERKKARNLAAATGAGQGGEIEGGKA